MQDKKQILQSDRQVLIERVFRACDADCDGYLNLQEMRPFASMTGFDRPQGAWAYEFRLLCVEHDRDPEKGVDLRLFHTFVNDQNTFYPDAELRAVLIGMKRTDALPLVLKNQQH